MKVCGVIPARLGSTRLAEKILLPIAGKPMIQHVWERSKKSQVLNDLLIACDDEKILKVVKSFGGKAVLTSKDHQSGTDRIIEAVKDLKCEIVVNIQGDEPLIDPKVIDELAKALLDNTEYAMATVVKTISDETELNDPNVVKVVLDHESCALYFSRSVIPYQRSEEKTPYYKHLGLYAYRKEFLMHYHHLPVSALEKVEKLEQLRALQAGIRIKTILTETTSVAVDTQADLNRVEKLLKNAGTK